jgi:hypothetical protein
MDSSLGIMARLRAGRLRSQSSIPGRGKRLFSVMSRLAVGSTQPSIQWVLGDVSLRVKQQGYEADHYLHIVSRSRMWSYHFPIHLHGVLIKPRYNFI